MKNLNQIDFKDFIEIVTTFDIKPVHQLFVNPNVIYKRNFKSIQNRSNGKIIEENAGTFFEICGLVASYARANTLQSELYLLEYTDEKEDLIYFTTIALLCNKNKVWFNCFKTGKNKLKPIKGCKDKGFVFRSAFKQFIQELRIQFPDFNQLNLYANPFEDFHLINSYQEYFNYFKNREYLNKTKKEISSMAIVFCKNRCLLLRTNNNEWVFPKGHIEENEESLTAAKRECKEESDVSLDLAQYLGAIDGYYYIFNGSFFRVTDDTFYENFGCNKILKQIDIHVFVLPVFQKIKWQVAENFKNGEWVDINKVRKLLSYSNTITAYDKAINLYKSTKM